MFDAYGATETGPIAFECRKKKMHVCSDLVYTEFMKNRKLISAEEPSSLIITKLYGEGTPIIRYIGIDDIVTPSNDICDCGLGGNLIKKIYGRDSLSLVFPGNKVMLPSAINEIFSRVLYEFKTRMISHRQIIQHKVNEVEIKVVINHKLKEGASSKRIFSMIKDGFNEKIGHDSDVIINIKEVKKIDQERLVISKIDKSKFKDLIYL
jgi:phenylacetate-CoA ligase